MVMNQGESFLSFGTEEAWSVIFVDSTGVEIYYPRAAGNIIYKRNISKQRNCVLFSNSKFDLRKSKRFDIKNFR